MRKMTIDRSSIALFLFIHALRQPGHLVLHTFQFECVALPQICGRYPTAMTSHTNRITRDATAIGAVVEPRLTELWVGQSGPQASQDGKARNELGLLDAHGSHRTDRVWIASVFTNHLCAEQM